MTDVTLDLNSYLRAVTSAYVISYILEKIAIVFAHEKFIETFSYFCVFSFGEEIVRSSSGSFLCIS